MAISRSLDVLLIQDNEADLQLAIAALTDAEVPIQIHTASDGETALAFLKRMGAHSDAPRPDLILLDLGPQKIDGFEVLAEIKGDPALRNTPVVVSGSEENLGIARIYDLHAVAYLVKPVESEKYFDTMRAIKELWFHMLSLPPKKA
jgi:chemotaxis family two-component system response regulator Rcp1